MVWKRKTTTFRNRCKHREIGTSEYKWGANIDCWRPGFLGRRGSWLQFTARAFPIPYFLLLSWRPGHWAATEQMDVNMVDGLAAIFAGVDHGAVTLRESFGASYFGGCPMKMADQRVVFLACLGNGRNVQARNNEDVYGRLRIDVGEGITLIVLIDGFGRNTSIDDPAEKAIHD
jgi:hypothetical protein